MEKKHIVGIFSRSNKMDYAWLVALLSSRDLEDRVADVVSSFISNHGFKQFIGDVYRSTFGILYHTKNRGRINITDIKEALYDEELKTLHEFLGRGNVMVVVDDLEDSSDQEKMRILQSQPSIQTRAGHLLLVSKTEKDNPKTLVTKLKTLIGGHAAAVEGGWSGSQTLGRNVNPKAKTKKENSKTWYGNTKSKTPPLHKSPKNQKISETQENNFLILKTLEKSPTTETVDILYPYDISKIELQDNNPEAWYSMENKETSSYMEGPMAGNYYNVMGTQFHQTPETWTSYEDSETEHIYEIPDDLIAPNAHETQVNFNKIHDDLIAPNAHETRVNFDEIRDDLIAPNAHETKAYFNEIPDDLIAPNAHKTKAYFDNPVKSNTMNTPPTHNRFDSFVNHQIPNICKSTVKDTVKTLSGYGDAEIKDNQESPKPCFDFSKIRCIIENAISSGNHHTCHINETSQTPCSYKDPERKINNTKPKGRLYNENDGACSGSKIPEEASIEDNPVTQYRNKSPKIQSVDLFKHKSPKRGPSNEKVKKWLRNEKNGTWYQSENSEEAYITEGAVTNYSPESRPSNEKVRNWLGNEKDGTWNKSHNKEESSIPDGTVTPYSPESRPSNEKIRNWLRNEKDGTWNKSDNKEESSITDRTVTPYSPESRPSNEKVRNWLHNKKDGTWNKSDNKEESSITDGTVTPYSPESRPDNERVRKWLHNKKDGTWNKSENSEEASITDGMVTNYSSEGRPDNERVRKWLHNEKDGTWYKSDNS